MKTVNVGKRKYQVISREETATKYPGIHAHGVVAIITASFGESVFTINERAGGYDKPRAAWNSSHLSA